MSQTAAQDTGPKYAPRPVAHGATFSGLMVAMWSVFVTLLVVSRRRRALDALGAAAQALKAGWPVPPNPERA